MEDEREASQKRKTCEKKRIYTENSKSPTGPFVSPFISRFEHEKQVEDQRCKRTKLEDNFEEVKNHLFQEKIPGSHSMNTTRVEHCEVGDTSSNYEPHKPASHLKHSAEVEAKELHLILKEKQETLRKLNLVRMYRKKNDLQNLQELINKWRNVSQEGSQRLPSSMTGEAQPTMSQLLNELQIDHELIQYSIENEAFW